MSHISEVISTLDGEDRSYSQPCVSSADGPTHMCTPALNDFRGTLAHFLTLCKNLLELSSLAILSTNSSCLGLLRLRILFSELSQTTRLCSASSSLRCALENSRQKAGAATGLTFFASLL